MGLQVIIGDYAKDKRPQIIDEIVKIKAHDSQAQVLYLVPDHLKFNMETYILEAIKSQNQSEQAVLMDIQVVSFSRLAWYFQIEQGDQQSLSDLGLTMIIRQIIRQHQDQLIYYARQAKYHAFAEKLLVLFKELMQGNIEVEALDAIINHQNDAIHHNLLQMDQARLKELQLLYGKFLENLQNKSIATYTHPHKILDHLASHQYPHHYLYIDHYYHFNSQEMGLVLALAQACRQLTIHLDIDQASLSQATPPALEYLAYKTYKQVKNLCSLLAIDFHDFKEIQAPARAYQPPILTLARTYAQMINDYQTPDQPISHFDSSHHHFYSFDSIQTEIRFVANEIHRLVVEEGYRYRDIVIKTRNLTAYETLIGPIFAMNKIPYFFDNAESMARHPLFILVKTLLQLQRGHWQTTDILTLLKSPLMIPATVKVKISQEPDQAEKHLAEHFHQIQVLENIILSQGYYGYYFFHLDYAWLFPEKDENYIDYQGRASQESIGQVVNRLRTWIHDTVYSPLEFWTKETTTADQAVTWFFQWMEGLDVAQELEVLRDQAIDQGEIGISRKHEQVWQVLMQVLDEAYQIMGSDLISFEDFAQILISGMNVGTYHIIPPSLDQVQFTSLVSPQVEPAKITFLVGLDPSALGQVDLAPSLLTADNRQQLKAQLMAHQYLADPIEEGQALENALIYQTLLSATDHIYFSVPSQVANKPQDWAPVIKDLLTLTQATVQTGQAFETSLSTTGAVPLQIHYFGKWKMNISPLLNRIRLYYIEGRSLPGAFKHFIQIMRELEGGLSAQSMTKVDSLIRAIFHFNPLPQDLDPELAQELYGRDLYLSVSKLESYYSDPYSYFLLHGLKLTERQAMEINPSLAGQYFHQVLDLVVKQVQKLGLNFHLLTPTQLNQVFQQVCTSLKDHADYAIFNRHPQWTAIKDLMDHRLMRFLTANQEQSSYLKAEPLVTELLFGMAGPESVPGLVYPLNSGGKLHVRGKVDRIDGLQADGCDYLQVIDYKSGNKSFNLVDFYYGMDLQILTYLAVGLQTFADRQPVGAFYSPLLSKSQEGTEGDWQERNHVQSIMKNDQSLSGVLILGAEALHRIDPLLEETQSSLVYPAKVKKDGQYKADVPAFIDNDFQALMAYCHYLIQQAGQDIQAGKIQLMPYKNQPYTTSLKKDFRVITGFDATQNYQQYRYQTVSKKQVMEEIKQKLAEINSKIKQEEVE